MVELGTKRRIKDQHIDRKKREREREENDGLFQRSANYGLWDKPYSLLTFVLKPLLEHRLTHSFTIYYYLSSGTAFVLQWQH